MIMKDSHSKKFNLTILTFALILATSLAHSTTHVPLLTETIMKKIFNSYQYMVIYVCEQQNPQVYEHFSDYCLEHSCAFLDKNNELYDSIKNFVGHPHDEYFLILDAPRQEKYVLEIKDKDIKYKDIYNFEADFTSQKLKPYFSSEEEPTEVYEPCRKLVGKNFDSFLALKAPIKVVYLHTEQPSCTMCGQMLRGFADISQKLYRDDVIAFGYFDIFKNDHEKIPSEVAPYFLVFQKGEEQPFGIEGQKFPELQTALVNIIAGHLDPEYRNRNSQNNLDNVGYDELIQAEGLLVPEEDELQGNNYEL